RRARVHRRHAVLSRVGGRDRGRGRRGPAVHRAEHTGSRRRSHSRMRDRPRSWPSLQGIVPRSPPRYRSTRSHSPAGATTMTTLFVLCLLTASGSADAYGYDATSIRWVLPKDFKAAVERANEEHRLLLIKGVSFNIDEVGATCATKGTW